MNQDFQDEEIQKWREWNAKPARLVEPPRVNEIHEEDSSRVGGQSGLTAAVPQPANGD